MNALPILTSFWLYRNAALADVLDGGQAWDVFADSGAFSAWTTGAEITVGAYAEWLEANRDRVNFAAGLDVIGDADATRRNLDAMRERVQGIPIVPTFHVGSDWSIFEALCKTEPFVALGGAVGVNRRRHAMLAWLAKAHTIAKVHGTRLHGFGMTRPPYPSVVPWYSVDSSYWKFAMTTGVFMLWDRRTCRWVKIKTGSPIRGEKLSTLRSYGLDPQAIASRGFAYVTMRDDKDAARAEREQVIVASLAAWLSYGEHLRRGRAVPAPPGVTGDGPKVYLAVTPGNESSVARAAELVA